MKYYEPLALKDISLLNRRKQAKQAKNKVLVMVLKICGCIIWCFEQCVKFLNKPRGR